MTATESYLPDTSVTKISKKQIFLTGLTVLGIVSLYVVYGKNHTPIPPKDEKVVVQAHQTLWGIEYEEYGDKADVRQAIDQIEQRNGITCAGDIHEGDVLYMPVIN